MGMEQTRPLARRECLKTELDKLAFRVASLNQEMMRLPIDKRRERWQEYYKDLSWLMKRQQELSGALTQSTRDQSN